MMDERDYWYLLGIVGLLALGSVLHYRMLRTICDAVAEHDNDITQLKDGVALLSERIND